MTQGLPLTILFGAFDRHNFGDLLFPHIAAALLRDRNLEFAGLAQRDLRSYGGHRVRSLSRLAAQCRDLPANILHAGGELLTCDAWEAAVMLLPPAQARAAMARCDAPPQQKAAWARSQLGIPATAPYTVAQSLFPNACKMIYNAVGGVDLDQCSPSLRTEVLENLRAASAVGVRDRRTLSVLEASGIRARLMPDPAAVVDELFGKEIRQRAMQGEVARVRQAFPQGYVAVQFSADFGADHTLAQIGAQLARITHATGLGIAFFRAGAAPWHDDLRCYQRIAARLQRAPVFVFASLHLWDICALLASSSAYCGSSLHGRIVAMAFGLPRVNLRHPSHGARCSKQAAYAQTWEEECMPGTVDVQEIADGVIQALGADRERLRLRASELAALYRTGFETVCAGLM